MLKCTQIQYHYEWTKYYFESGGFKLNFYIPMAGYCEIDRQKMFKEGSSYPVSAIDAVFNNPAIPR